MTISTIVANDTDAHQAILFHVEAESAQEATRLALASSYNHTDELQLLGICAGRLDFQEAPGHGSLIRETLPRAD